MSIRVVAVGEILWDLLPSGKQLGGAPANFAYHAHALGAEAAVITCVGNDALGCEILERLHSLSLSKENVTVDPKAPTGTVTVELAADGQPKYTIHENVAWDNITPDEAALKLAARADAICFGSLAQRSETSRNSIRTLVAATPANALRIFDINLRQHFFSQEIIEESLRLANVLKLNDTELPVLAKMFALSGNIRNQLQQLADRYNLRTIALTRGSHGSLLFADGEWSEHAGLPIRVVDTIGAGDAFTASMALGLLSNWPLDAINCRANEIAAFVCSHAGATPTLPEKFRHVV